MFKRRYWRGIQQTLRSKYKKNHPQIIPRSKHRLSRQNISDSALKVLYRLNRSGYNAYLVGGGVRDVLLGLHPKDFDVATNAHPEEIHQIFRNSRLIGRRFRLVHVFYPHEIIEVSTFRAGLENNPKADYEVAVPLTVEDNTYGTIEEDAWRRDFTINALYYDIKNFSLIDYTNGLKDIHDGVIRMIGDPTQRFHEDPVRLLRAIRLAAKLNFRIEAATEKILLGLQHLMSHIAPARLFNEMLKLFFKGHALNSFQKLVETGYLKTLFPALCLVPDREALYYQRLFEFALQATDERYDVGLPLNPGFLMAIFSWPVIKVLTRQHYQEHKRFYQALHSAVMRTFDTEYTMLAIPRRLKIMMRSVWILQYHLERRRPRRIEHIYQQRYFRAAFDFLELRAKAGEPLDELVNWWRAYRDGSDKKRQQLRKQLMNKSS